jgi:hypothetical protein
MARHVFLVFSSPVAGKEEEFNNWYDNVHIYEALTSPGFVAAQRFRISNDQVMPAAAEKLPRYVTVYELETDDLAASVKGVIGAQPTRTPSDAPDRKTALLAMYTECAPRAVRKVTS